MTYLAKKIYACLMISGLILAALIWFLVLPIIDKINQLSENYLENQQKIENLDKQVILFQELKKNYLEKENRFLEIEQIYLPEKETIGFISDLEAIANQSGNYFEIKTASAFSTEEVEEKSFLSLSISLWGDFNSLLEFLANLEDSPYPPYRLTEIDRISMQKIGERGLTNEEISVGPDDLETILDIKVYME